PTGREALRDVVHDRAIGDGRAARKHEVRGRPWRQVGHGGHRDANRLPRRTVGRRLDTGHLHSRGEPDFEPVVRTVEREHPRAIAEVVDVRPLSRRFRIDLEPRVHDLLPGIDLRFDAQHVLGERHSRAVAIGDGYPHVVAGRRAHASPPASGSSTGSSSAKKESPTHAALAWMPAALSSRNASWTADARADAGRDRRRRAWASSSAGMSGPAVRASAAACSTMRSTWSATERVLPGSSTARSMTVALDAWIE